VFNKILIANRGEIACRVAATARKLGIATVAVYSDADAQAKHVAMCDQAFHIGASAARDSYLQWQRIIDVAGAIGAQAIHPGYGFLSENPEFAAACVEQGLVFIGPSAASIRAMGLKAQSKRLMQQAGVPLVPGYHGSDQNPELLHAQANQIGYPVLIKASAGGGGRGMRVVQTADEFMAALESCQREALNSFGNDAVLIEKYVQRPRHIEMQIFADSHGNCIHLFERDCSVQRRHQKVIEEAPAPGLPAELREQMGQAAVAAARAVDYVGAGTVEFIVEQPDGYDSAQSMRFYFMEMNTRLQVEHPVTEAITGLDLVQWQILVASGEPLPLSQEQIQMTGHAIEVRICAENPEKQFLPATGTLAVYRKPAHRAFEVVRDSANTHHPEVRIDDGVRAGDAISAHYDSMIAKLIVHGPTREQALTQLGQALAQTHIVGLASNVDFLGRLVRSDAFVQARLDTALIERESTALFGQDALGLSDLVASAVAYTLLTEQMQQTTDPFSARDGFRLYGSMSRGFIFEYRAQATSATLTYRQSGGGLQLQIGDEVGDLSFGPLRQDSFDLFWRGQRLGLTVYAHGEVLTVFAGGSATQITVLDQLAHASEDEQEGGRLTAPMPGNVVSFAVKVGDVVSKGQPLAVIEAMKMEHTICAPADGVVQELLFSPGEQVAEGVELLKLQATEVSE